MNDSTGHREQPVANPDRTLVDREAADRDERSQPDNARGPMDPTAAGGEGAVDPAEENTEGPMDPK